MSSAFRVSAAEIERRLPEFIPQGRGLMCCVSSIVILMFIFMNSHFIPDFPVWMYLGVLLMAGMIIRYASFQQLPHRPPAYPPRNSDGHAEELVNVPTFVTREQLPDIRIQLAQLSREFNDSDYDALRALDEDVTPNVLMSEEDINAFPIYNYQVRSNPPAHKAEHRTEIDGCKFGKSELACSVCMEQVNEDELIRRLPCSHEFHASCITPWLQRHGTCPICKRRAG